MDSAPIPVETLLAHREWVRAVAVAVVRDPNAADDVEQETWLAALRTPPRDERSLRGWFGAVARSRARRIGRTDARRDARELAAPRHEPTASAAELAELADTHRRVVQAVVDLPEPYRETILLRYFEGLAVDDVATRTSVPLDTARSRISRGLAKLRERLSREFGTDDRPWALALAPLIAAPKGTGGGAAAAGGGVVMASTSKTVAVVVALVLLAGVGAVVATRGSSDPPKETASAPTETPAPAPSEEKPKAVAAPPRVQRPRQTDDAPPASAETDAKPRAPEQTALEKLAAAKVTLECRDTPMLEVLGELSAKTGVEIAASAEAVEFWGRDDKFHMQFDGSSGKAVLGLVAEMKGLAYVVEEPRIVLVPKGVTRDPSKPVVTPPKWTPPTPVTVIGRVVDADGAAVVGAEVHQILNGNRIVATTDVAGRYEVKLTKPYGSLQARTSWQIASLPVAVSGESAAQVTVDLATRGRAGALVVRVDRDGAPLDKTWVTLSPLPNGAPPGSGLAFTDAKGVATFQGVAPGDAAATVKLPGHEPATAAAVIEAGKAAEVALHLVKKPPLQERVDKARVTVNVADLTVGDLVSHLTRTTNVNIALSPALMEKRPQKVAMNLADVPLKQALTDLCTQIGATFEVRDDKDVVWIVPAKR